MRLIVRAAPRRRRVKNDAGDSRRDVPTSSAPQGVYVDTIAIQSADRARAD
jgi:hypothetical protein